jgi:hypothetical protein
MNEVRKDGRTSFEPLQQPIIHSSTEPTSTAQSDPRNARSWNVKKKIAVASVALLACFVA